MIIFNTDISGSSAERMRIGHDGAFCFGSDSARPAECTRPSGFSVRWDQKGQFQSTVSGETCGLLNREGSDGGRLSFRRGGTGVGEIGVTASASSPEIFVKKLLDKLKNNFDININEAHYKKEDVYFKVPQKLKN